MLYTKKARSADLGKAKSLIFSALEDYVENFCCNNGNQISMFADSVHKFKE